MIRLMILSISLALFFSQNLMANAAEIQEKIVQVEAEQKSFDEKLAQFGQSPEYGDNLKIQGRIKLIQGILGKLKDVYEEQIDIVDNKSKAKKLESLREKEAEFNESYRKTVTGYLKLEDKERALQESMQGKNPEEIKELRSNQELLDMIR